MQLHAVEIFQQHADFSAAGNHERLNELGLILRADLPRRRLHRPQFPLQAQPYQQAAQQGGQQSSRRCA